MGLLYLFLLLLLGVCHIYSVVSESLCAVIFPNALPAQPSPGLFAQDHRGAQHALGLVLFAPCIYMRLSLLASHHLGQKAKKIAEVHLYP